MDWGSSPHDSTLGRDRTAAYYARFESCSPATRGGRKTVIIRAAFICGFVVGWIAALLLYKFGCLEEETSD